MRGMRTSLSALRGLPVLLALLASAPALASDTMEKPRRLGLCTACHAQNGRAIAADAPHLDGQRETYLAEQLRQFRDGRRKAAAMNAIAGSLGDADIEALARWFASQDRCEKSDAAEPENTP